LKLSYLFVDFALGWRFHISPFLRSGGWLVMERGWWDLAVDPRRYRLDVPTSLIRQAGHLLPRPDLILVLDAPVAALLARKSELDEYELTRQMILWRTVLPKRFKVVFLDATRSIDVLLVDALAAIRKIEP
jgi:thymidylate kinase